VQAILPEQQIDDGDVRVDGSFADIF